MHRRKPEGADKVTANLLEPVNPFICSRCGKQGEGGIQIEFTAAWGSKWDTGIVPSPAGIRALTVIREICDDCFKELVPDLKERLWLADTHGYTRDEIEKIAEQARGQ